MLAVLALLAAGLVHVVGRQRVQARHLVLLKVPVVQAGLRAPRLQKPHKVLHLALAVVLQRQADPQMELGLFLPQDAEHLVSIGQLVKVQLNDLICVSQWDLYGPGHLCIIS
uniref:Putative secreted protein n=1 Tax=Ixodes ricinus TaxID=34613 RepID=A0A6B0UJY0_IXORI